MICSLCGKTIDPSRPFKAFGPHVRHIECNEWYVDLQRQVEANKQHRIGKRLKKKLDKQFQMPISGNIGPLTNTLFDSRRQDEACLQCGHSHIRCRCCNQPLPCRDTGYDDDHVCDDCMRFTIVDDANERARDE